MKVAGENPEVDVYFVNTDTGARTKVASDEFVDNNPSEVVVVAPELAKGTYTLEVISQFAANTLLKEPRTCSYAKILTVK